MGTRGAFGFIVNEQEKIAYNHFDSYPEGLGATVIEWLRAVDLDEARTKAEALMVVDGDTKPTPEQIAELQQYANMHVGGPMTGTPLDEATWYQLLRDTQGQPEAILAAGVIEDASNFPLDSLFCEWGYIVDFDKRRFEVYEGFQKKLPKKGRWKGRPTKAEDEETYKAHVVYAQDHGREPWRPKVSEYKAIELVTSWDLIGLPSDDEFQGLFEVRRARRDFDYYAEKGDNQAIADEILQREVRYGAEMYADEWAALMKDALTQVGAPIT